MGDAFSLACSPPVAEVDVITNNLRFQSLLPKISSAAITMIMTKIIMMMVLPDYNDDGISNYYDDDDGHNKNPNCKKI